MRIKGGLTKLNRWQYVVFLIFITMIALTVPFLIAMLVLSAGGTPVPV